MVPKQDGVCIDSQTGFRAVLFRMVPKPFLVDALQNYGFRAVLFRMVPKLKCRA